MKRIMLLAFSITLLCAGVYMLSAVVSEPSLYNLARGMFGALVFTGFGGFLLWDDFLQPLALKRQPQSE